MKIIKNAGQGQQNSISAIRSSQSKSDLETIKTTMDTETGFISRDICLCLLNRKNKVKKKRYVGYESAVGSVVKPADALTEEGKETPAMSPEPNRRFMFRSQSVENLIH